MGTGHRARPRMQGLLVLVSLTVASAQVISHAGLGYAGYPYGYTGLGLGYTGLGLGYTGYPYGYNGLGLGYGGLGFPYTFGANILKPADKEAEEGEARKKRDADAQIIPYSGLGYAGYPYGYTGLGLGYTGLGLGYTGYPYGYSGLGLGYGGLGFPYTLGANILKPAVEKVEEGEARKKRDADDEEAAPAPITLPLGLPFGYSGLGYPGLGYSGLGYAGLAGLPYTAPTVTEVEVPQYKYVPQVKTVPVLPACQNAWGFGVPC